MAASFAQLTPLTIATALEQADDHLADLRRGARSERLAAVARRRRAARLLRTLAARLDAGERALASEPTPHAARYFAATPPRTSEATA